MFKKKKKFSPIVTFILLTFATIVLSGFLSLINVQTEYTTVNKVTNELVNNVIEVKNLFSVSGIKHIVTTAVSSFVEFAPLSTLIITLIGIGVAVSCSNLFWASSEVFTGMFTFPVI